MLSCLVLQGCWHQHAVLHRGTGGHSSYPRHFVFRLCMLMGGLGSVVSSRVQAENSAKTFLGFLPQALCMLFLCASAHTASMRTISNHRWAVREMVVLNTDTLAPVLFCCCRASQDLYHQDQQPWQTLVGSTSSSFKQRSLPLRLKLVRQVGLCGFDPDPSACCMPPLTC